MWKISIKIFQELLAFSYLFFIISFIFTVSFIQLLFKPTRWLCSILRSRERPPQASSLWAHSGDWN